MNIFHWFKQRQDEEENDYPLDEEWRILTPEETSAFLAEHRQSEAYQTHLRMKQKQAESEE